jgi:hypothetical protein
VTKASVSGVEGCSLFVVKLLWGSFMQLMKKATEPAKEALPKAVIFYNSAPSRENAGMRLCDRDANFSGIS